MSYTERTLAIPLNKSLESFPAIVITGPRQSGKTTMVKHLLGKTHMYISLESPDVRMRAKDDPRGFLEDIDSPVILDEIQYVPELLPYIKTSIDENRRPGFWVLTGSQNFTLMHGVSESLAGRAAVLSLLPFSFGERTGKGNKVCDVGRLIGKISEAQPVVKKTSLPEVLLKGGYPEIALNSSVDKDLWCGSYISTYLERDIRNLAQVGDLNQFERFLRLCAGRTGQILNLTELARDIGIAVPTAQRWLSFLETGYQVLLLYPYYKNIGKRLIKRPKLYFTDTSLACYLSGIRNEETLLHSPQFSYLFETFIIADFWKRFLHFGQLSSIYYLRTQDGLEIDLALEINQKLHLFEIKSSSTITSKHAGSLVRMKNDLPDIIGSTSIISRAPSSFHVYKGIHSYPWQYVLSL